MADIKPSGDCLWIDIIKSYKTSRLNATGRRKAWGTPRDVDFDDIHQLIQLVVENLEKSGSNQWKTGVWFRNRLRKVHKIYQSAGVMAAQGNPYSIAPIKGFLGFIIQAILEYETTTTYAKKGIEEIQQHIGRWERDEQTYCNAERIQKQISELYKISLEFLLSANCQLLRGRMNKAIRAMFASDCDEMRHRHDLIRNAEMTLSYEVQTQSESNRVNVEQAREELKEDDAIYFLDMLATYMQRSKCSFRTKTPCNNTMYWLTRHDQNLMGQLFNQSADSCRQKLLHVLSKDAADGFNPIPNPTPDTCQWIYTQAEAQQYLRPISPGLITIHGFPGCGKSVLARSMVLELQDQALVLSFHFRPSFECAAATLSQFVASLLQQILSNPKMVFDNDLDNEINQLLAYFNGRCQSLSHDVNIPLQALRHILSKTKEVFVLLIDGIDEYRDRDKTRTIKQFASDISAIAKLHSGCVIVFCRSDCQFTHLLASDASVRMEESVIEDDIYRYAMDTLSHLGLPTRVFEAVQDWIRQNACGSFLLVKLYLKSLHDACTEDTLQHRLVEFPAEVFSAFDQMLGESCNRLSDHQTKVRQNILKIVLAADKALSVKELACLEGLVGERAKALIPEICSPLIEVREDRVVICHPSAKEYLLSSKSKLEDLRLSEEASCSYLATRQLKILDDLKYSSPDRIGRLIRLNTESLTDSLISPKFSTSNEDTDPGYEFAARSWYESVVKVQKPDTQLLNLLEKFLLDPQFVYWAEYIKMNTSNDCRLAGVQAESWENGIIVQAHTVLSGWVEKLPPSSRELIDLDQYCIKSYERISQTFASDGKDYVLQWLALRQLSNYLFTVADIKLTFKLRQQVMEGLVKLLGAENPLALRARLDAAFVCFYVDKMELALKLYTELYASYSKRLGADSVDALECLGHIGQSQYFLTKVSEAKSSLQTSIDGLKAIVGANDIIPMGIEWLLALTLDLGRQEDMAFKILSSIFEYRTETHGSDDLFAVMVECSLGDISRRRGDQELAMTRLNHAYKVRSRSFKNTNIVVVDVILNLLVLYWHVGLIKQGKALAYKVELASDIPSKYQRHCQLIHLMALLSIDGNDVTEATHILRKLFINCKRKQYNRALFWAFLDLATLLRAHAGADEASSLFHHIVTHRDGYKGCLAQTPFNEDDEPDPPRYLEAAEKALILVRKGKRQAADQLLESQDLTWVRDQDLWLWFGMPLPNTQTMRAPFQEVNEGSISL